MVTGKDMARESDGSYNVLQRALHENFVSQCGFRTLGLVMLMSEYREKVPDPTRHEIRLTSSGNTCRCGGHHESNSANPDAAKVLGERRQTAIYGRKN